ncbi:MAG TPA: ion transporter [Kofleriaceae bacterium]|nr:ion transporter [Kofleriaceae bacterium]
MGILRALTREPVVIGVILLSTAAMFALGFTEPGSAAYRLCLGVDIACVIYFLVEAIGKLALDGVRGYWAVHWNRFDLLVLLLSLPVLAAPRMSEAMAFVGVPVLRLTRLFRLFRLLRFIPEHDRLGAGVVRALKASVGVFLAIMLVNFILAMGAQVLFSEKSPEHFGDPARACYSMFRIFTVEGWNTIPDDIAASSSAAWATVAHVYFGFALLVGGILGLSLGNAVFVDQMVADNHDQVESDVQLLRAEVRALHEDLRALSAALRDHDRGGA